MFKKSFYNFKLISKENNSILLYNSRTNALGIMDEETRNIYDSIENYDFQALENLTLKDKIEPLLNNGYIISDEINELDLLKLQSHIARFGKNNSLSLTIAPTMDCNMACPYCYENKTESYMDEPVQEVLYDFVTKNIENHNCKYLSITWYGGEPLLAKDVIYNLSKRFIEYCDTNKIQYSSGIVTNGYLLDYETALKLTTECNINRAQITIDGMPEVHNKRRVLKNGEESFDTIIKNITECKDIINIHIRINVDNTNKENLRELWYYFNNEKGWGKNPSYMFAPVHKNNDCQQIIDDNTILNQNEYKSVYNDYLSFMNDAGKEVPIEYLIPRQSNIFCGALKTNNYVVDSDGDLYTCWNAIGQKDKTIGNIINFKSMNAEYIKWLMHEPNESCHTCKYLPICAGGCPYQFFINGKPACDSIKYMLFDKLETIHKLYIKKKANPYK